MENYTNNGLVMMAQSGCRRAMEMLWGRFCELVLGLACSHTRKLRSDSALEGLSHSERIRAIMGFCYETFYNATMAFDLSRGVPLEAYYAQKIDWAVRSEKRKNSIRASREERADDFLLNGYEASTERDNSDMVYLTNAVEVHLARNPKLQKFFGVVRDVYNYYDRNEKEISAEKLSCTRASVYNNLKATRQALSDTKMEQEFLLALAS